MKTGHDYFVEYQKEFEDCSDEEVLKWFNREVNNGGMARHDSLSYKHYIKTSSEEGMITPKLRKRNHSHLNIR